MAKWGKARCLLLVIAAIAGLVGCRAGVAGGTRGAASTADIDSARARAPGTSRRIDLAVSLGRSTDTATVACWLTEPSTTSTVLLIAVPGSTYSHVYWDFPCEPQTYSFARAMSAAGYACLTVDRVGTGASSRPRVRLTGDVQSLVIHELIAAARAGGIGGSTYRGVVVVGHSLGSCEVLGEAARYGDADALIVTGLLHAASTAGLGGIAPGRLLLRMRYSFLFRDPLFAGSRQPVYTTRPGERAGLFYAADDADGEVVAMDERTKAITSLAESTALRVTRTPCPSTAPVLVVVGERDGLFCSSARRLSAGKILAGERHYYPMSRRLDVFVLPAAGHDVNLHRNAAQWYTAAAAWIRETLKGS